jgi:hypothetical protein
MVQMYNDADILVFYALIVLIVPILAYFAVEHIKVAYMTEPEAHKYARKWFGIADCACITCACEE